MAYQVFFNPAAKRDLEKPDKTTLRKIRSKTITLSENPRPQGAKKIKEKKDHYRLRMGDYRILYKIKDRDQKVIIVRILHRKDVYRRL
jgi:mRNA interferase RelE/StbE